MDLRLYFESRKRESGVGVEESAWRWRREERRMFEDSLKGERHKSGSEGHSVVECRQSMRNDK